MWQPQKGRQSSIGPSGGKKSGKGKEEDSDEDIVSDNEKDGNAIDMRREDAELEKILRDYNNESRQGKKKRESALEKPLDLPFYKGIQLPQHLNWISIYAVSNFPLNLKKQNENVLV